MPAFTELDWRRFDVWAIVAGRGLATIAQVSLPACEAWLQREGYRAVSLDFSDGIGDVVVGLGEMLDWRGQFGYDLDRSSRNLNALRDGFHFDAGQDSGVVLLLRSFANAWQDDALWSCGLLEIASEHSLRALALGKRFFVVVVLPDPSSMLVGQPLEGNSIPGVFSRGFR